MPKNQNITGPVLRAIAGVASVLPTASAPATSGGTGGGAGMVQCDVCGLNLPRSATHQDVVSHSCYQGFTKSVNAAGHIVLA